MERSVPPCACPACCLLLAAVVLFLLPSTVFAQHGGGHGGHGGRGTGGPNSSGADPDLLNDLHHAMAVQAFGDQPARFQSLTKSTETAKQQAAALQQQAAKPSADYSTQTAALAHAVDEVQGSSEDFLSSFSKPQKSGLKDLMKKVAKANSEVTKERKDLDQQVKSLKSDPARVAEASGKLAQALDKLHSAQVALGAEMGLQQPS